MKLSDAVYRELRNAEESMEAGNHGRARVCARRAVGAAIADLLRHEGNVADGNVMRALEDFLRRQSLPEGVLNAGKRLVARVRPDFTSVSSNPVADATAIIDFIAAYF